jgi:putative phosphoribosyl transferase
LKWNPFCILEKKEEDRMVHQEGEFVSKEVKVTQGNIQLPGLLTLPDKPIGIVLFAHGSGSSRFSPRNVQVAHALNQEGIGTLLFDLLNPIEAENRENVFNISLLASRLAGATHWIRKQAYGKDLPLGYFGASTGGGAALWAAADMGSEIAAVVSRGGRPDMAIPRLAEVTSPSLMLVGGNDEPVIEMNKEALKYISVGKLIIVPGATHLFEEPGTLEMVSKHAADWFKVYFQSASQKTKKAA